jgi:hypothetical protein
MKRGIFRYDKETRRNMDRTDLLNAAPTDRAVMAVTELQMRWELNDKKFDDEMISTTARSWSLDENEFGNLSTFLCEFVMDMREDAESYDED